METKWVKARNGRMVQRTYISEGERWGIAIVLAICFVGSLFLIFAR